ncbi:MAG TPA: LuxR C-terminal-related transcriptional regulator [Gaiellaceae bacterium]|nr:LuxR C-terminal-related transcriptional regulator [Gaiellaceae bacterium]
MKDAPRSSLEALDADVEAALEHVNVPSYVIDASGIIRWVNPAGRRIVGDVRGRQFTSVVAPEDRRRAREVFAQKIVGNKIVTESTGIIIGADGQKYECEISGVRLTRGGHIVGVFGQVPHLSAQHQTDERHPHLTPRQAEVLRLLEHGRSTAQIAQELHLSQETVRNHVRHLLRALGVNSRLEAVAVARRLHSERSTELPASVT